MRVMSPITKHPLYKTNVSEEKVLIKRGIGGIHYVNGLKIKTFGQYDENTSRN